MTEKEYYKIDVLCENCSNIIWFFIPKGLTTEKYFKENKLCSNCGCEHGRDKLA